MNQILYINEKLDDVDSVVFTGDSLHDVGVRNRIKYYAERWLRAINEHEDGVQIGEGCNENQI